MLFTWEWKNRCIIFQWWHVKTITQFILSMLALICLSMGYEYAKYFASNWEAKNASSVTGLGSTNSLVLKRYKIKQSFLYGLQVGYSFMLMLVFMSYSGWFMIAVVVGAAIGKYIWSVDGATRSLACH